jgi:tRNA (guanine26-N2/guanine27-N2)-dimethyltransferase
MAASGIRSIRYALELNNVKKVIANDYSKQCIMSINKNSKFNGTEDIVQPSLNDAKLDQP